MSEVTLDVRFDTDVVYTYVPKVEARQTQSGWMPPTASYAVIHSVRVNGIEILPTLSDEELEKIERDICDTEES